MSGEEVKNDRIRRVLFSEDLGGERLYVIGDRAYFGSEFADKLAGRPYPKPVETVKLLGVGWRAYAKEQGLTPVGRAFTPEEVAPALGLTLDELLDGTITIDPLHPPSHGAAKHTDVTRELFIPMFDDSNANVSVAKLFGYLLLQFADGATGRSSANFKVPDDFVSFSSLKAVWVCAGAGNLRWKLHGTYAAHGEMMNTHDEDGALGETAIANALYVYIQEPSDPLALTGLAKGDVVGVEVARDGGHANDTIDAVAYLLGLVFEYTAEQ